MNSYNIQFNSLIYKIIILLSVSIYPNISRALSQQPNDDNYANVLYDSARVYYRNTNYDVAIQYFNKILLLKSNIPEDIKPEYFKIYNWLGLIHKKQGRFFKAIDFYEKAIERTSDEYYKAMISGNIANIYSETGDYAKAISYLEKSLIMLQNIKHKDKYQRIVNNYHNQGHAFYKSGQMELALKKDLECIRIANENNLNINGSSYYNTGLAYQALDSLDKADFYFNEAIKFYIRDYGKNHYMTAMAYKNYGAFNVEIGEFEKSKQLYQKAYAIFINTLGNKHLYTSYCFRNLGNLYTKKGKYKDALNYYQKSLISKIFDFNDSFIYINPNKDVFPDLDLLNILKAKAQALEKLAEQESRPDNYRELSGKEINLKVALSTLELTVSFIEQLRTGYLYESSKLQLASKEHETYLSIISIANSLYEISGDIKYADIAFKYAEYSKYAILRELKNEEMSREIAGVPDSISGNERRIKEHISSIRMQIEEESKLETPDRLKIDKWNEQIFGLTRELEDLMQELESNYPVYYRQKYSSEVVNLAQLQKTIDKKEAILEYVLGDSILYTFVIVKDTFLLLKQKADSVFYSNLESYKTILHRKHSSPYIMYRNAAFNLYERLIKPAEPYLKNKNLLIIPDNKMEFIAFEAFIDKPYKPGDRGDYRKESYILRKYSIGYAYSSTLYENSKNRIKRRRPKFLGFAPGYIGSKDSLPHLPLAIRNVRKIAFLTLGKSLTNNNATESNFKKYSNKYDIIHFYAHGFEDTLNPANSKLCLSPPADTLDNSYLYAWEVYNMQLNARLVVLASCYSGAGKLSKGEGVLSIGRSFINAGSLSVIMALWSATYESTIFELNTFYQNLVKGKRKDDALRLAKLKYLEKTDPINAHPRFWASLVITGNQDALYHNFFLNKILLFICIVLFVIIIVRKGKLFVKLF